MPKKIFAVAALSAATLLAAAPAFADGRFRHAAPQRPVVVVQHARPAPYYYARRPVIVHQPVVVRPQPVVAIRAHSSNDVLGGLIVGAVLGAVIASHAGY